MNMMKTQYQPLPKATIGQTPGIAARVIRSMALQHGWQDIKTTVYYMTKEFMR